MTEKDDRWMSSITEIGPNKINVRGYPIEDLMGNLSLAGVLGLLVMGELLPPEAERVLDAVLVSSCDHGTSPPSALAARIAASTGASLSASISAGILSINRHHGGAIEGCMRYLLEVDDRVDNAEIKPEDAVAAVVEEYGRARRRIPGFGHRLHSQDPRAVTLREILAEQNLYGRHMEALYLTEAALKEESGRDLPLNVDGAAAGALLEIGFPPEAGNVVFIMSRVGGLSAHVAEEIIRERPMRVIDPRSAGYDGPGERRLDRGNDP
jgi:citrate synthase